MRSITLNRQRRSLASSVLHSLRTLLSGPVALSEFAFLRSLLVYLALKAMLSLVLDGSLEQALSYSQVDISFQKT